MDAHEMTGEYIKYMDTSLLRFLKNLQESSSFANTKIIIVSDHGNHSSIYRNIFGFDQAV